jgi:hypothetical protein
MNKYIVILSIIIVLYFVQKYCIQSEVEKFLLTKNIIEKFGADGIASLNGLNISGNIILGDKIVIQSDISGLKILDPAGGPANLTVSNLDISGQLTMRGGINFTGDNNRFTRDNALLTINSGETDGSVSIRSMNGPLILNGPGGPGVPDISNNIKIGGNIDISGLFTINNVAPMLTRVFISAASTQATSRTIDTLINAIDYPSITFSGFDNNNTSPTQYANIIEFNTDISNNVWFVSLTPAITAEIRIRVTFFHKNLVDNQAFTLEPPTIAVRPTSTTLELTMTRPSNYAYAGTTYTATAVGLLQSTSAVLPAQIIPNNTNSTITINGLSIDTDYSVTVTARSGDYTSSKTETFRTTVIEVPNAPSGITAQRIGNDIFVKWTPPTNGPVTKYSFRYDVYNSEANRTDYNIDVYDIYLNGGGTTGYTELATGQHQHIISGLQAGQYRYKQFYVVPYNTTGPGAASPRAANVQ